jgi:hypothetical protein
VYDATPTYRLRPLKKLILNCVKSVVLGFKLVHVIATNRLVQMPAITSKIGFVTLQSDFIAGKDGIKLYFVSPRGQ